MAKLRKLVYSIASFAIVLGSLMAFSAPTALAAPAYDYQLISQSAYPATLAPGATTNVYIEVKNTGTATWGSNIRLGSGSSYGAANQQRDYASEFANSDWLSANRPAGMSNGGPVTNIIPGWVVRFQFNIKAPTTAGTYKAYFTPVADGTTWMKDIGIFWQITVSSEGGGTPPPSGSLAVGLASSSPASANIARGARGVTFSKFQFNGGTSASSITTLVVKRIGAGAPGDFDNVYLYDGDARLTSGRSINSSTNEVTFSNLNVSVPSNGSKVLSVVGDIAAGAGQGNSNAFEIESAAKISGSTFTGTFPVAGSYMTNAAATVGTVTVDKSGSITDPKIGDIGAQIAEFKLTAGTEDISVRRIALYNSGSINSANLTNLKLKLNNGTEVATSTGFVNDIATFVLASPVVITNGSNKIFQLFADVTGRKNDTIKISIDNDADLYATGNTYGYGTTVTRTAYDNSALNGTDASWCTLLGGTITVTSNGPATADIGQNLTDKAFLNLAIASGANAEVRTLTLKVTGSDLINAGLTAAYFTNIKISDGSTIVAGPKELVLGGGDVQTLAFTDRFNLTAGQTRNLVVSMNVSNLAPASSTVHVDLVAFGATDIKSLDTNDYITDIVPSTDIVGKTMTVKVSGLSLSLASTPASQNAVINKQNIDTVGLLLTAGAASAVTVTSVKFTGYIDANGATGGYTYAAGTQGGTSLRDVVSSVALYNATSGQLVDSVKTLAANGTVIFSGISIAIPAAGTVKLVPRVNVSASDNDCSFYFDIATAATDITSQDSNNADITETGTANNAPTVVITMKAVGTLTAATSAGTPTTTIAQAGSNDVEFSRVKFYAIDESFTIQTLQIKNASATDINLAGVTLTYGSTSVTGYISGQAITFTGLAISVPKDGNTEVIVKANMNTISGGAVSGAAPQLNINYGSANNGTDFKAIGSDSAVVLNQLTSPAADLAGQAMVVRKTKPVITSSAVSGTLAGAIDIYNMTINAGSGADASFKQFVFNTSATFVGGSITGIAVYKDGVAVTPADYVVLSTVSGGTTIVNGDTKLIINWATGKELVVSQGTSSTISIKGTAAVTGASTFTAALAQENTTTVETGLPYLTGGASAVIMNIGAAGTDRNIIWSDNSSTSHNAVIGALGSTDWSNGYPLTTLPGATFAYTRSA